MTETIKVEVDQALARRFRKRAMEKYGYKKGAMKTALENAMRKFAGDGKVDWGSLVGAVHRRELTSVELQHAIWSKQD